MLCQSTQQHSDHHKKEKFFSFIFISWKLITLQYCSSFCLTLTRISHGFPCVPHPDPLSPLPFINIKGSQIYEKIRWGLGKQACLYIYIYCWYKCKLVQPLWRMIWLYPSKWQRYILSNTAVPFLEIYPTDRTYLKWPVTGLFIVEMQ